MKRETYDHNFMETRSVKGEFKILQFWDLNWLSPTMLGRS